MNLIKQDQRAGISDFQLQQFQDLMAKLYQCCQERIKYQSERFNLPDAELRCLLLFGQERYLTSKSIAQKMNVAKSRVTKVVNGLVKKNMVQRLQDPEDSRVTLLSLTAAGHQKLSDINQFLKFVHNQALQQLEPEQRKTMLTNLYSRKAALEATKELML